MSDWHASFRAAKAAFDAGDVVEARRLIELSCQRHDPAVAALLRDCYLALGESTAALGEISRLRRIEDTARLRWQARFVLGRLRETDTNWLPGPQPDTHVVERDPAARSVAQPTAPSAGPARATVLHLLKESLPYTQTGFTFRSRATLDAQRRAGFDPVVVTSLGFPWYDGVEDATGYETVDEVPHHRLSVPDGWPTVLRSVPYDVVLDEQARQTFRIADDVKPAVVQAGSGFRGYDQALVGLATARRRDVPFVYEVRGFLDGAWTSDLDLQEKAEQSRRRRGQDFRCMQEADVVLTIADSMRDELVKRGVDASRIHVIPNVVDVDRFTPRPKNEELARSLGIHDRFVVGYISNLGWREGVQYLLRATAILAEQGREVACLVAGDGPQRPALLELVTELGLDEVAVLPGHVPNDAIEDYYALIDAFVVPRVDDQAARLVTPLKPLEAMAMRRPVVTSDLPALREMVAPGERGLTAPAEDAEALARTIVQLMDEPGLADKLVDAAAVWVHDHRTIDANAERYQAALSGLIA